MKHFTLTALSGLVALSASTASAALIPPTAESGDVNVFVFDAGTAADRATFDADFWNEVGQPNFGYYFDDVTVGESGSGLTDTLPNVDPFFTISSTSNYEYRDTATVNNQFGDPFSNGTTDKYLLLFDTQNTQFTIDFDPPGVFTAVSAISFFISDPFDIDGDSFEVVYNGGITVSFNAADLGLASGSAANGEAYYFGVTLDSGFIEEISFIKNNDSDIGDALGFDSLELAAVPEPGTIIAIISLGLVGLLAWRRIGLKSE